MPRLKLPAHCDVLRRLTSAFLAGCHSAPAEHVADFCGLEPWRIAARDALRWSVGGAYWPLPTARASFVSNRLARDIFQAGALESRGSAELCFGGCSQFLIGAFALAGLGARHRAKSLTCTATLTVGKEIPDKSAKKAVTSLALEGVEDRTLAEVGRRMAKQDRYVKSMQRWTGECLPSASVGLSA